MFDITSLLSDAGSLLALAIIGGLVFAECAFLIGLLMPGGEVVLPVAGILAAHGYLSLGGIIVVTFMASVAGYEVAYYIGMKAGHRILKRRKGLFIREKQVRQAKAFYAHHGSKTVLFSRFIGYIRTIVPLLAGMSEMQHRRYLIYNIASALPWTLLLVMIGYWLGSIHLVYTG